VAAEDPKQAEPQLQISELYFRMGDLANARAALDKAKELEPEAIETRYWESKVLQAEGRPREAIQTLRQVLDATKRPTYGAQQRNARGGLLQELAILHSSLEQTNEAVGVYREMIDLNANDAPRVTGAIIDTYRGGKKFDDAQKEAEAAIKKYPNEPVVRVAKASLDADLGRVDAAAADIRKLLNGGPADRDLYISLAGIYEKGRKWDETAQVLESAEKLSMDDRARCDIWFMRGAMFEKMKDIPKAESEFRKCLNVFPDNAHVLNYLGYMLADRNQRLPEALEMIQKAVKGDPGNGAFLDSLGWVYYRLGRFTDAEMQIRKAVEISPGDPTMHDHFADVLVQQSKLREAIAAWEESLRQWQASSPADRDAAEINRVQTKLEQARSRLAQENRQ
jgi:tetratricopeptide (TPR) repeat protein